MSLNIEKVDAGIEKGSSRSCSSRALQIAVGVGLVWWMVSSFNIDGARLVQVFRQAAFMPLVPAVLCFGLSIILKARQYMFVVSSPLPTGYVAGVTLSQNALLTFLPWRMGELALPLLLRRDFDIPVARSIASLITIRAVDLSIVVILGLVIGQVVGLQLKLTQVSVVLGAAVITLCLSGFVLPRLRSQTLEAIASFAPQCLRNPIWFTYLVIFSLGIFLLSTLQSMLTLQAFGLSVSLHEIALLNAVTLLVALIPIHPPGGWGTIDSIQVATLHYLGYAAETSAPIILAAHCFYTVLIVFGAMLGWLLREKGVEQ